MPQVRSCAVPSAVLGTQPSTWVEVFQHGVFEPEDQEEKSFGWTNRQGSDTILLLKFAVRYALQEVVVFLKSFKDTAKQGQKTFYLMYSHGPWLPRVCVAALYCHLMF